MGVPPLRDDGVVFIECFVGFVVEEVEDEVMVLLEFFLHLSVDVVDFSLVFFQLGEFVFDVDLFLSNGVDFELVIIVVVRGHHFLDGFASEPEIAQRFCRIGLFEERIDVTDEFALVGPL